MTLFLRGPPSHPGLLQPLGYWRPFPKRDENSRALASLRPILGWGLRWPRRPPPPSCRVKGRTSSGSPGWTPWWESGDTALGTQCCWAAGAGGGGLGPGPLLTVPNENLGVVEPPLCSVSSAQEGDRRVKASALTRLQTGPSPLPATSSAATSGRGLPARPALRSRTPPDCDSLSPGREPDAGGPLPRVPRGSLHAPGHRPDAASSEPGGGPWASSTGRIRAAGAAAPGDARRGPAAAGGGRGAPGRPARPALGGRAGWSRPPSWKVPHKAAYRPTGWRSG